MRLFYDLIPRLHAPLRHLTRQSLGPSPALTAKNAATRPLQSNSRMSTSSEFQSTSSSSTSAVAGSEAGTGDQQQKQTRFDESHQQHHPTESTSPAPENATSNAPSAAAATPGSSSSPDSSQPHAQRQPGQPLALPPLPETSGDSAAAARGKGNDEAAAPITLDLGGQAGGGASTRLDHLGPLVVHQDGTMSRINNWGEMTEIERQNTLRVLGRRNQIRLASLRDGAAGEREGQRG